jgi:tetratricopeptide (TPR) repeat protein
MGVTPYFLEPPQSEVRGTRFSRHWVNRVLTDSGSDGTLYCPTGLLALANEYRNADRHDDEAAALERYLSVHPEDEGNAYLRLGDVLAGLGRKDDAREAYERGIPQAEKFGHSGMAEDLRLAIARLGGRGT